MRYGVNTVIIGLFVTVALIVLGVNYLRAFPTIPKPKNNFSERISMFLNLDYPYVHKDSSGELLLNTKIVGGEAPPVERAPVNLVLVVDRSGSMSEKGKIEYARDAAKHIISGLGEKDRLSVVAYSTDVELLYPIQLLLNKKAALSAVSSLYPTDSTNLSGGLIAGIGQLEKTERDGYLNRVILLSDGLANAGITDYGELIKIASAAAEKGIHVTTMGLGVNYDEDLLTGLSEYGAGNYYFVESPSQLAGIFDREFGQLASTVAKSPEFTLALAPGVTVEDVYGYTYRTTKEGEVRIKLGDFYSGQERNIMVRLKAPSEKIGVNSLVTASLEFQDVLGDDGRVALSQEVEYQITEDSEVVAKNENKEVTARKISVDAAAQYNLAATAYEEGDREEAVKQMNMAMDNIQQLLKSSPNDPDVLEQQAEIRDALSTLNSESAPAPASPEGMGLLKDIKNDARQMQK